jgi:hypothetical protein
MNSDYDTLEDYKEANNIKAEDPLSVKVLGSKAVNSLKLTQLS